MTAERQEYTTERLWATVLRKVGVPLASVVLAIALGSLVVLISGGDPVAAFTALLDGAFGSGQAWGETIMRATPLVFTGLAIAYGFRAGLFNIGAEGQLFLGGLAAALFGLLLGGLPSVLSLPVILVAAALFGAAWAFIPALLKAKVGAHEVITTMMFSYIGLFLVSYIVNGPLKAPGEIPQTRLLPDSSTLPTFTTMLPAVHLGRAHLGFLVAVLCAIAVWLVLKYTTLGYEARAVGLSPWAAETGGISVAATTVKSLCISGALAGLAGAVQVLGVHHRLFDQFSSGFGFTGIAVALLAKNHPLAVVPAALLFGALSAGAGTMQLEAGVPDKLVSIIQALVIFFVAAETIVTWAIRRRQKEATAHAV